MSENPFTVTRGLWATILRDSVFGCNFTTLRVALQHEDRQFLVNFGAAMFATIASGPLNYARNRQYAFQGRSGICSYMNIDANHVFA